MRMIANAYDTLIHLSYSSCLDVVLCDPVWCSGGTDRRQIADFSGTVTWDSANGCLSAFVQLKLLTALLQMHDEAFQPSRMESKKLADQFLPGWLKEQPHISTAFHSAVIRFSKARLSSKI